MGDTSAGGHAASATPHAEHAPLLTVLYATETGNAEDMALRAEQLAHRYHVPVRVFNVADYDRLELVDETHVVFIVSTTGQGDFPVSARPFWRFLLREGLPGDILGDLHFATLGLGDSTYTRFCWAARMLTQRLKQLGAVPWMEDGEADERDPLGLESGATPWLAMLGEHLAADLMPAHLTPLPADELLPPRWHIEVQDSAPLNDAPLPALPGWVSTTLMANERMTTEDHFQDVRLLELRLPEEHARPAYQAGDVACVRPQNPPEDVDLLLRRLGWDDQADQLLRVSSRDPRTCSRLRPDRRLPPALAQACDARQLTLRRLLTEHLDLFSVPRSTFFALLQHFAPKGHLEQLKLADFVQPGDGMEDMYEYAQLVRRTIAEVLHEFKSVQVPLAYVMDLFPLLRERQYSLASAPALAVAVVKFKTRIQKPRVGVTSTWLAGLAPGTRIDIRLQPGTLLPPARLDAPMLCIGPGTGIAPLRSLVLERLAHGATGAITVVAGCRHLERDCLFRDEWTRLADGAGVAQVVAAMRGVSLGPSPAPTAPPPLTYYVAASRDQAQKVYVQDVLREHGAAVWELLGVRRGIAYLCGSSGKMPEQVRAAVLDVIQEHGHMDEDQARRYFATLENERRWQEECW